MTKRAIVSSLVALSMLTSSFPVQALAEIAEDPTPEVQIVSLEDENSEALEEENDSALVVETGAEDDEALSSVEEETQDSSDATSDEVAVEEADGDQASVSDEAVDLPAGDAEIEEENVSDTSSEDVVLDDEQVDELAIVDEAAEADEQPEEDGLVLTAQAYDTMQTARSISLGSTYSGSITSSNERDFYRFTLPSAGRVKLTGSAAISVSRWYVYDAAGSTVWSWTYASANSTTGILTLNEQLDLTAGTYYLCAERYGSNTGNYNFILDFTSAGESFKEAQGGSDNSISAANAITIGTTYKGQIARNDDKDFYKFTLSTSGRVTLTGNAAIATTHWYVYDAAGSTVWSWTYANANSTTGVLTLNEQLDLTAGTYYLCAERYSNDYRYHGNYSFKLGFASAGESFKEAQGGSDNSTSAANAIKIGTTYKGQIARNDDKDFYKFTLSTSGRVTLTGNAAITTTHWYVYDAAGNEVWSWKYANANSTTGVLTLGERIDLTSGTYYLCAERYSNDYRYHGNYSFKLGFASAGESFKEAQGGSDNSTSAANAIKIGTTYKGQIARNDDKDFYKFTLSSASGVTVSINSGIKTAHYYIYDAKGNEVWSKEYASADSTTGKYTCFEKVSLGKGAYYFCVERYYNDYQGNYSFRLYNGSVKVNPIKATVKKTAVALAYTKVKAANQTLASNITVSRAQGAVTYANASSNATAKKFTVNKTTGKVTVPKGTKAGTYAIKVKVTAAGNANYRNKTVTLTYKIKVYAANTMTAKATKASVSVAYSTVKSKAVVTAKNVTVSQAKGTVTYKNVSTNAAAKKFTVNKTTGKVTVPKGTAKGTYVLKVKVSAAGNAAYAAKAVTVSYKVVVK